MEGLIYGGKFACQNQSSLIVGRKFTVFVLFDFVLRAISKYKPGGPYIWRDNLTEGFSHYESLGGLYMEGLIFRILWYSQLIAEVVA